MFPIRGTNNIQTTAMMRRDDGKQPREEEQMIDVKETERRLKRSVRLRVSSVLSQGILSTALAVHQEQETGGLAGMFIFPFC